ncbi:MAG: hypothetical protein IPM35_17110 [Myxococcales bacterium]|nr:hypothetical protein [Myxococcales bacterium]
MSHSPYGRNQAAQADKPNPPRGKVTTPEEARASIAEEPRAFEVTPEEAAAVIAMRDAAERWGLDPARVARLAAKSLFLASDVTSLGHELGRTWLELSPELKERYAAQLERLARAFLDDRAEPGASKKKRGKSKPADVNPDAGHGAADGFGGSDFPAPGPDEDRPL